MSDINISLRRLLMIVIAKDSPTSSECAEFGYRWGYPNEFVFKGVRRAARQVLAARLADILEDKS